MKVLIDWLSNNAEWLNVIATFFAAIIAGIITIVFGKRQEDLQKKQILLSEYEINKQLYTAIKQIDELSEMWLSRVYLHFAGIVFVTFRRDTLTEIEKDIDSAEQKFEECVVDFELKLGEDLKGSDLYKELIRQMRVLTTLLKEMEDAKVVVRSADNKQRQNKDALIDAIIERINVDFQDAARWKFDNFRIQQKKVESLNALTKIKKQITPISAK